MSEFVLFATAVVVMMLVLSAIGTVLILRVLAIRDAHDSPWRVTSRVGSALTGLSGGDGPRDD